MSSEELKKLSNRSRSNLNKSSQEPKIAQRFFVPTDRESYDIDSEVFRVEKQDYLRQRREAVGKIKKEELEERPTGVCFSGGGIRSGAYCLGALRAMQNGEILKDVDYLSTVSGGGYTGSAFISHIFSEKTNDIGEAVKAVEDEMKKNCGYLVNRDNPAKFALDFLLGNAIVLFLFIFGKMTGLVLAIYPMTVIVVFETLMGDILYNSVFNTTLTYNMKIILACMGSFGFVLLLVTRVSLASLLETNKIITYRVMMYIRAVGYAFAFTSACLLATCLFEPIWLHVFRGETIFMIYIVIVCFTIAVSVTKIVPTEFLYLLFPVVGVFIVSLTWYLRLASQKPDKVNWSDVAEWARYREISLKYDAIWFASYVAWNIIATFGSTALMHRYYGWRLRRSFYAKDQINCKMSKELGEKVTLKGGPYYISNVTLNDYRRAPNKACFHPFLLSPHYSGCHATGYVPTDDLGLTLGKCMALSGAAFTTSMGRVDIEAVRQNEMLFLLFGLSMGDWIAFPNQTKIFSKQSIIPWTVALTSNAFLALGVFLNDGLTGYWGVVFFILAGYFIFGCAFVANLRPVDIKKNGDYLFKHFYAWKALTEMNHMLNLHAVGPVPPAYLHISDGGHFDNLGLVQLLKRQCKVIYSFDGGHDPNCTAQDLLFALDYMKDHFTYRVTIKGQKVGPEEAIRHLKKVDVENHIHVEILWNDKYGHERDDKGNLQPLKTDLWYIKLKKCLKDSEAAKDNSNVCLCCGTFPYVSTACQFFNQKLFEAFYQKGKRDCEDMIKDLKNKNTPTSMKMKKSEESANN